MKVLIAVKGSEDEDYFRRVAALAPLQGARIILAHVVDTAPRSDQTMGRERFMMRRPLSEERSHELSEAESQRANAALQRARAILDEVAVPAEDIREVVLRGKINEELRRLSEQENVDLIVVQGRPGKPGPHSLGKTARFLVDHAPHGALLVR